MKDIIKNAARFSNFAQKFKTIVWGLGVDYVPEKELDNIALELWDWLNISSSQIRCENTQADITRELNKFGVTKVQHTFFNIQWRLRVDKLTK